MFNIYWTLLYFFFQDGHRKNFYEASWCESIPRVSEIYKTSHGSRIHEAQNKKSWIQLPIWIRGNPLWLSPSLKWHPRSIYSRSPVTYDALFTFPFLRVGRFPPHVQERPDLQSQGLRCSWYNQSCFSAPIVFFFAPNSRNQKRNII